VRLAQVACFAVPALVLLASYAWLALDHGTLLLWGVVVHESGRYTLGETILYFSHFLREVPITVGYALFLLGISGGAARWPDQDHGGGRRVGGIAVLLVGALASGALLVTAASQGWGSALQDLFQYRMRDDLSGYGTHWRYHWLSTLWFGAAVGVAPALAGRIMGVPGLRPHRFWTRVAWAYFLALTLVFGLSADIFVDARYAGHQAREIMTHGPVTLLLGVGIVLMTRARGASPSAEMRAMPTPMLWILAALSVLVPAYLAMVSLSGDIMEQGQSDLGLVAMVGAHYFEHSLDYLFFLLLLAGGLTLGPRSWRHPSRG